MLTYISLAYYVVSYYYNSVVVAKEARHMGGVRGGSTRWRVDPPRVNYIYNILLLLFLWYYFYVFVSIVFGIIFIFVKKVGGLGNIC